MTDTKQPEALRLAEILEGDYCPDWFYEQGVDDVAAELRRLHAENTTLQQGYDAARLEIEALRSRQCLHGISEPSGWMPIETAPKDGMREGAMGRRFRWTRAKYRRAHHLSRLLTGLIEYQGIPPPLVERYLELWARYPQKTDPLSTPLHCRYYRDSIPF